MAALEDETAEGYPCKKFFRSRAHCNPLSNNDGFEYPVSPDKFDWADIYPAHGAGAGAGPGATVPRKQTT